MLTEIYHAPAADYSEGALVGYKAAGHQLLQCSQVLSTCKVRVAPVRRGGSNIAAAAAALSGLLYRQHRRHPARQARVPQQQLCAPRAARSQQRLRRLSCAAARRGPRQPRSACASASRPAAQHTCATEENISTQQQGAQHTGEQAGPSTHLFDISLVVRQELVCDISVDQLVELRRHLQRQRPVRDLLHCTEEVFYGLRNRKGSAESQCLMVRGIAAAWKSCVICAPVETVSVTQKIERRRTG